MTLGNRGVAFLIGTALALAPAAVRAAEPAAGPARSINLNTASAAELEQLPGVGEARAKEIVAAREKRGGFKSVDDLVEVKGIGKAALEKLRPLVTTGTRPSSSPR
ncbi:MAG: helix-hairpin-helix domain-containing protein [Deltaproteobacteria bacterium]|nr:helix-hairpin-helix domain-containing protein [Deltaproteobacteria bacterium]